MAFVLGDNFNLPIKVMTGEYEVFPAVVSKIQFIVSSLRINDTYKIEKTFITGDESSVVTYDENEGVFLFPFSTAESSHFVGGFQVQARCYFGDGITLGSQIYIQTQYASLSAVSLNENTSLVGGVVDSEGEYVGYAPYTVTVNIPQSRRVPYGVYIRYSANADGTNFTITPQSDTKYVGFAIGNEAPTEKEDYMWTQVFINPPSVLSSIIENATVPVENTEYSNVFNKEMFQNQIVRTGDEFFGIWFANNSTHYAVKCKIISIASSNLNVKVLRSVLIGNPTQTASDIAGLESDISTINTDSQNNIRNIQWVDVGVNAYSIKFTRKDGSTATVSVPLTAIKNELNSLYGRLDTAESDIDTLQSDVSGLESEVATKQNKTDNALQTTNKNIVSAINEVREIAIGAEKPVGFANYQTMITAFNALSATTYEVGQSIFIGTLDVPDVWVLAIEQTSVPYTYTTDEAIVNALKNGGSIQVGYYRLSQLETGKVTTDHSELSNLDYANSGHTGFQPTLVSGTNIKTINNQSVLGSGNIEIQSGADDYDDLEHIPVVNADLETIVPVENTYYRHAGTGGGGAVATPFVLGQTYDKVYFDTSKTVEEMETILSGLEYEDGMTYSIVGYDVDENPVGVMICELSAIGLAESGYGIFNPSMDTCFFSTELTDLSATVGWQNLDDDGSYTFNEFSAEYVNNVSFLSASPFESQFIDGVIYLYRDGEYQPLYGGRPMRWGTIQGTVTDQQDLVQYLNGFSKTVVIESGQSDVQGIPQLTAQQITTACDEFQQGANVLIKKHNSASYLAVIGATKLSTILSEVDAILYNGETRYYLNYLNTNGTVSITQNTLDTNAIVQEIGNIETALQTIRGTAE